MGEGSTYLGHSCLNDLHRTQLSLCLLLLLSPLLSKFGCSGLLLLLLPLRDMALLNRVLYALRDLLGGDEEEYGSGASSSLESWETRLARFAPVVHARIRENGVVEEHDSSEEVHKAG